MNTNGNSAGSWRRQMWLGVIPALLLGACSEDPSTLRPDKPATFTATLKNVLTGEIHELTGTDPIDPSVLEDEIDGSTDEKAGCVHIRFCSATFFDGIANRTNTVVCDTNDQACSSDARFKECNADAQFVCGKTRPMGFDPGIRCPITGICSDPNLTLIWLRI
jgi:hypothetical protein